MSSMSTLGGTPVRSERASSAAIGIDAYDGGCRGRSARRCASVARPRRGRPSASLSARASLRRRCCSEIRPAIASASEKAQEHRDPERKPCGCQQRTAAGPTRRPPSRARRGRRSRRGRPGGCRRPRRRRGRAALAASRSVGGLRARLPREHAARGVEDRAAAGPLDERDLARRARRRGRPWPRRARWRAAARSARSRAALRRRRAPAPSSRRPSRPVSAER